jgi:MOSC domain-containing protein
VQGGFAADGNIELMGTLTAIYVSEAAGAPMRALDDAELVAGQGIAGDRYLARRGTYSTPERRPSQEVTLVEIEQVDAFNAAYGAALGAADLRRNLVTRGVALNDLVGVEFTIGGVVLKGIKLCEPCSYIAGRTQPNVLASLAHRAGLRAAILAGGRVRVGDAIAVRAPAVNAPEALA